MAHDPALIARIGDRLASVLREWLAADEMATVRRRNAEYAARGETYACASHEFCDANVAMQEAFEAVMGRGVYLPYQVDNGEATAAQADDDIALWNAAWDYAKREHLSGEG